MQNTTSLQSNNTQTVESKRPMFDTIDNLRRNHNLVDNSITLHYLDGSTKVQTINKAFVYENSRMRSTEAILEDFNAIVHDDGASHFSIE